MAGVTIPDFLSHLPRDRRGLPVPYVNRWGLDSEGVPTPRLAWDRHAAAVAVFADDGPGETPDFTAQHMARQRECVAEGLCQVCARNVPWSRRWLVVADMSVERVDVPGLGRQVPVVTEPWLCERCARFAVERCPALIRRRRDERLSLYRITSKLQCRLVASVGWVEGDLEEQTRKNPPVMWLKIAVAPSAQLEVA